MIRGSLAILACLSMMFAVSNQASADSKYARWAGGDLQIRGYDTTAYFQASKPTKGKSGNVVTWKGGTWYFRTAQEAALFKASPSKFTPRFGAYCTGGLSQRHVVNGNPKIWRMHKGRHYMFYAHAGARRFDKNPEGVIAAARAYAKTVGIVEN